MPKHGSASMSTDQFAELAGAVVRALPRDLSPERAQFFIERGYELTRVLRQCFEVGPDVASLLHDWQGFWSSFGVGVDFSGLATPPYRLGLDRLLVVPAGMTPNRFYDLCQKDFPCWRYAENLDAITSVRTTDRDYAIWARDRKEADEELKNFSANDLEEKGIPGITLLERLIYGFKFFCETGEHLDVATWTLCSGSRDPNGYVPHVRWDLAYGKMNVNRCDSKNRRGSLRARTVVSA